MPYYQGIRITQSHVALFQKVNWRKLPRAGEAAEVVTAAAAAALIGLAGDELEAAVSAVRAPQEVEERERMLRSQAKMAQNQR